MHCHYVSYNRLIKNTSKRNTSRSALQWSLSRYKPTRLSVSIPLIAKLINDKAKVNTNGTQMNVSNRLRGLKDKQIGQCDTVSTFALKLVVLNNVLFFSLSFGAVVECLLTLQTFHLGWSWQRSNKKPLCVYQIWSTGSVTRQNLEIDIWQASRCEEERPPAIHYLSQRKTLWLGGLPSQSSITSHLH